MRTIWEVLGIDPTRDRRAIKSAYARRLKLHHPEDDPEGFRQLREAYELALSLVDSRGGLALGPPLERSSPPETGEAESLAERDSGAVAALLDSVRAVYRDEDTRLSLEAWKAVLRHEALWSVDARERFQSELFRFLTRYQRDLGDDVWRLLEEEFQWRAHAQALYRSFRDPYEVDRVLDRIHRAFASARRLPEREVRLPGGRELFESSLPESTRDDLLEKPVPILDAVLGGVFRFILGHFFDITGGRKLEISWALVLLVGLLGSRFWFPASFESVPPAGPRAADARQELERQAGVDPASARRLAQLYLERDPRDFDEAFFWFESAARRGDAEAQARLGDAYREGWAGRVDPSEAAKWYRFAAERGHPRAMLALGLAHLRGAGVTEDEREAFRWISKAASHDVTYAQAVLGSLYESGRGVAASYSEAAIWYRRASDRSHWARAQLGRLYERGLGVERDPELAAELYLSAAEALPWAQLQIGRLYAIGVGVPHDDVEAFYWLSLASREESLREGIRPRLDALRLSLTSADLQSVERRLPARDADDVAERR